MKQFVTALDNESGSFKYQDLFCKVSEGKAKAGKFIGPQVRKIMECPEFLQKLAEMKKKFGSVHCCSGWISWKQQS